MSVSWLLIKKTSQRSIGRLGLMVSAIGLGTVILLSFISGINGLLSRYERGSWSSIANPGQYASEAAKKAQKPINGVAPLRIGINSSIIGNTSMWRDKPIFQIVMHATGDNSPEFSDLKTPKKGEYYLSTGLEKVAREHPDENIKQRFGTTYLGTIPSKYSSSPDALEVIKGANDEDIKLWDEAKKAGAPSSANIYSIDNSNKSQNELFTNMFLLIMFTLGGTILLFPIVMFISVSTQLGSAQREQRYAALRLIGATRKQVNSVSLLESFIATTVGIAIGSLVYLGIRPLLGNFEFDGAHFWIQDLTVSLPQYIIMSVLTIVLSLIASWWGMRKIHTSPLGVARREKINKKARFWRVIPLAVGIGIFVWLSTSNGASWVKNQSASSMAPLLIIVGGVLLVMFGLIFAGAWLTGFISRLFALRTRNAIVLLSSRRISGHSRKVFRSVSGLVLALFAGSFYLASVSSISDLSVKSIQDNGYSQLKPDTAIVISNALGNNFSDKLAKQPYIKSIAKIYELENNSSLIPCNRLQEFTKHSCPNNASSEDFANINFTGKVVDAVKIVKKDQLPKNISAESYLVLMTHSDSSIDKLRSFVISEVKDNGSMTYVADGNRAQKPILSSIVSSFAALTYIGIGITSFVAVASLIVSTVGGLIERRKSLFTLRLGGMTIGQMKKVVLIESVIPLVSTSILAAGSGIWIAVVFLRTFSSSVRVSLSPLYFAIVIGSLVVAIIGIWVVLPILRKITDIEQNQTE